jgi:hypothetical protein
MRLSRRPAGRLGAFDLTPSEAIGSCSMISTLEDPDLDAASAVGGVRGRLAEIDIGAERVERHAALAVPLAPRDFGAAKAAAAGNADALGAQGRIADCTARFMARRKATRRSSCCAMPAATSAASSSGFLTSTMLMCTSESVIAATFLRSFSMSAPFLPMTMPGRAE